MLRRVENITITHKPGFFSNQGPVLISVGSRGTYKAANKVHRAKLDEMVEASSHYPVCFLMLEERNYWLFQDRWYSDNEDLTADQIYALIVTREQRQQQRIARAQTMVAMQQQPAPSARGAIPDDIKQLVWMRDGGRCRRCGSNVELQFDHIIPVVYGGATSPENLQVLCGPCNRAKGASV
jgi:5-methylcytosine-specific restriction endonuclease McrA